MVATRGTSPATGASPGRRFSGAVSTDLGTAEGAPVGAPDLNLGAPRRGRGRPAGAQAANKGRPYGWSLPAFVDRYGRP